MGLIFGERASGISEHIAQPLQGPGHRRLTQEASFRRTGDVALLQKTMEGIYEVQIQVT